MSDPRVGDKEYSEAVGYVTVTFKQKKQVVKRVSKDPMTGEFWVEKAVYPCVDKQELSLKELAKLLGVKK